jgi:dynein heavy chain 1
LGSSTFDAESFEASRDAFLTCVGGDTTTKKYLFVYADHDGVIRASTDRLPKSHAAALVVCCREGGTGGAIETADMLNVMTIPGTNKLQALQMYTRYAFLPTILSESNVDDEQMQDKLRQLDVALQHGSARLPRVLLDIHPTIQDAVSSNAKPDADDDLLNVLQSQVADWIVQIRKVTTLTTTPFVAETIAADELSFWSQLQAELNSIQEQLKSPRVEMTLTLLREAKRFVATLALENNTGLEQAITHVNDVNHFLNPLPLQNLQAARSLENIATAMGAIMDHLPKVRQSRFYTLERSVQLLEAITVVLKDSLLQVLQEEYPNFLFTDYKDYENQVRFPVLDVFVQFDDRFDEWKVVMADQGRRRKLTGLSTIIDSMKIAHKPLKDRLELIHEFRSSQESLREVVHVVLRDDAPDAIQQVEQAPRQIFSSLQILDLSPGGGKALDAALEEYDLTMDAMEERLALLLRDKLQACRVSYIGLLFSGFSEVR